MLAFYEVQNSFAIESLNLDCGQLLVLASQADRNSARGIFPETRRISHVDALHGTIKSIKHVTIVARPGNYHCALHHYLTICVSAKWRVQLETIMPVASHEEFQYLELVRDILDNGERRPDR
jgi:hypothetical protein